ncbi:MAG: ferritin-like domain-containing protein [Chloroflexota bacterium]|nr:ferritin-like domain-containing protein [Chloroflexota bacterium]
MRRNDDKEMLMQRHETLILSALREQRPGGRVAAMRKLAAAQAQLTTDVEVLNYALTLEHLEAAFYELASQYNLGMDPFNNPINEWVTLAGEQEAAHVATLTDVIGQLGGEPVAAAQYDFGVTDAASFLSTAMTLENLGVSAYDGAGQFLQNRDLLTAAGTIVAVEARHAAYLNLVNGVIPFPSAFEEPLPPEEVLAAASGFIVAGA